MNDSALEKIFINLEEAGQNIEFSSDEEGTLFPRKFSANELREICKLQCFVDMAQFNTYTIFEKKAREKYKERGEELSSKKFHKLLKRNLPKILKYKIPIWDEEFAKKRRWESRFRRKHWRKYFDGLKLENAKKEISSYPSSSGYPSQEQSNEFDSDSTSASLETVIPSQNKYKTKSITPLKLQQQTLTEAELFAQQGGCSYGTEVDIFASPPNSPGNFSQVDNVGTQANSLCTPYDEFVEIGPIVASTQTRNEM